MKTISQIGRQVINRLFNEKYRVDQPSYPVHRTVCFPQENIDEFKKDFYLEKSIESQSSLDGMGVGLKRTLIYVWGIEFGLVFIPTNGKESLLNAFLRDKENFKLRRGIPSHIVMIDGWNHVEKQKSFEIVSVFRISLNQEAIIQKLVK